MKHTTLLALPLLLLPFTSAGQGGILDLSFNGVGYVDDLGQGIGSNNTRAIHLRDDGSILMLIAAAGAIQTERLFSDGQTDGNWSTYEPSVAQNRPMGAFVELPDGKVVIATEGGPDVLRLLRYTDAAELDPTFGNAGVVLHNLPNNTAVNIKMMHLLPNGSMLLAGSVTGTTEQLLVARLLEDGSLDATFNGTGLVLMDVANGAAAEDMVLRPDGRILLGGYAIGDNRLLLLVQLMANGAMDMSFGTAGVATLDLGFGGQTLNGIALTPDGGIVAAGSVEQTVDDTDALLALFDQAGQLNTGFDTDGWLTVDVEGGLDRYNDVLVDEDGMILACGLAQPDGVRQLTLTRRALNGALETSFGTNGTTTTAFLFGGEGTQLALQDDGKVLVGGIADSFLYTYGLLARFSATTTGINAVEAPAPLVVMPNPAAHRIQIIFPHASRAQQLLINDASSRIVHREQLGNTDRALVDVSGLNQGVYQLLLKGNGQVQRATFVVAR